jgi:hypothetical protein
VRASSANGALHELRSFERLFYKASFLQPVLLLDCLFTEFDCRAEGRCDGCLRVTLAGFPVLDAVVADLVA